MGSDSIYHVVVNAEEQYSLWSAGRPIPSGWRDAGYQGTREMCLAHIEMVWTDMRPKSLRVSVDHTSSEK